MMDSGSNTPEPPAFAGVYIAVTSWVRSRSIVCRAMRSGVVAMPLRRSTVLATLLWLLSAALVAGAVAAYRITGPASWPWAAYLNLYYSMAFIILAAVGALVAARRPGNPVGWLMVCLGGSTSVSVAARVYVVQSLGPHPDLGAMSMIVADGVSYVLLANVLLLFPNGRLPSRAWRGVAWSISGCLVLSLVANTLRPSFNDPYFIANPVGISGSVGQLFVRLTAISPGVITLALSVSTISVVARLASSRGVERQQLKWFALSATLPIAAFGVMVWIQWEPGFLLLSVGIAAVAVAIGIAILRYRLYDIDIVIKRALVYGALTALLAVVYGAAVIALQLLLSPLARGSDLAVAGSTLVVAALFQPVRRRVQTSVDRWFYRRKYAAEQALATMGPRLHDYVDPDQVAADVVKLAKRALGPRGAWLWLPGADGRWRSREATMVIGPADTLLWEPVSDGGMFRVAELQEPSPAATSLRDLGVDLGIRLTSQGQLVGLLGLGPLREEREFTPEHRHLMAQLANHAGPALRVAQLVRLRDADLQDRERLEQEMRIAQMIQHNLLPSRPPAPAGWRIAAYYEAARAVGGDFYDLMPVGERQWGLMIGDVSGKGMPAALVMATTLGILRTLASTGTDPHSVLQEANKLLIGRLPRAMFVTCQYMVWDPQSGLLRYANAGHCPALWRHQTGSIEELVGAGVPLGVAFNPRYPESELTLGTGDGLLLYSDGVVETRSPSGDLYGFERLERLAGGLTDAGAGLIDHLLRDLRQYRDDEVPEDDLTLVLLQRDSSTDG